MRKVILVSGGNRGIGLEICRQLSDLGHKVIMGTRDIEKGRIEAQKIASDIDVQLLDVTSSEQIEKLAAYFSDTYGKLDVLINNAGIGMGNNGALNADLDEVKEIMQTNFYGPWKMTKQFLPLLKKSVEARIINVSSTMGLLDELVGGYAGYRMSKSALNALTLLTANELSNTKIKVNVMCPGWVKTAMGGDSAPGTAEEGADTAVWLALEENIPHGKFLRSRKVIPW
jgi:NAD(P)-dependent dehydrogenase (short-subunit alcohol dehydrogenase family)